MHLHIFLIIHFAYRCIQLIEPSLAESDVRYIQRLISIYMEQNALKSSNPDESRSLGDDLVHTIDDCPQQIAAKSTEPTTNESIWREAPGRSTIHIVLVIEKNCCL